jgi:CRISPR system Cascade subunit CasA
MTFTFNLIDQGWIPCIGADGRIQELSLRRCLTEAHHFTGIAGRTPLETAAIYRLLLAVLHSALRGPKNRAAWEALWGAGTFEICWLKDYLDKWEYRFDCLTWNGRFIKLRING